MTYYLIKLFLSAGMIVTITEIAKRNNAAASIIHSLPLTSVLAFIWIYLETKDAALIGRHAYGTFWYVLPTLPMFILMPWLIKKLGGFWPAFGAGIVLTVALYLLTMRLLKLAGVNL
ncbi:hypothetical protein EI77_02182 [Prosthecobacter fusiformis]|uniref:DUF3147 family protein n=1 Tax=Prosthecobacter fusiformis TaxID=48464 RepID=A0A4R7RYP4_9BACT|nr:DUF3147 family protein [Prosthecobacter fusiformis]TDU71064.1 hypothetical protein EI77_02182 [Prosthecobacter fusiformis]